MEGIVLLGAGFLLSVLWFDLMFDVQVRGHDGDLPPEVLASIAAYYRRVTTEATLIETKTVTGDDGTEVTLALYAKGGALGVGQLAEDASMVFEALRRVRTHRRADKAGTFRWYNDYRLPERLGGGVITVRLHGNAEDTRRKLNRTENLRPIPPGDPDFEKVFGLRSDAESINRGLEDTLYLRRAHSVGRARQHVNLIGWALMVNSLTLAEHRARPPDQLAA